MAAIGSFGGTGGSPFDDGPASQVRSVIVRAGVHVDNITFIYADGSTRTHGGPGGDKTGQLDLVGGDYLTIIEGSYDQFLESIFFLTKSGKQIGLFGSGGGTPFMITEIPGYAIQSFFGRSGEYIDALGIYIQKNA